jgi:hypothetical protein
LALLLIVAGTATLAVVAYTVTVTVRVMRDRRRTWTTRTPGRSVSGADGPDLVGEAEPWQPSDDEAAADFVQMWLDTQWDQRFG